MQAQILHNLASIPGVRAAAFATALPLELEYKNGVPISAEGKTPVGRIPPNRTMKQISLGLFDALGTRLIAPAVTSPGTIGSASAMWRSYRRTWLVKLGRAAGRAWETHPKGTDGPWNVIVGVAENVYDDGVGQRLPGLVYFPDFRRGVTFAIRSSCAGTASLLNDITAKIHAVNPSLPLAHVRSLGDLIGSQWRAGPLLSFCLESRPQWRQRFRSSESTLFLPTPLHSAAER